MQIPVCRKFERYKSIMTKEKRLSITVQRIAIIVHAESSYTTVALVNAEGVQPNFSVKHLVK